MIKDIQLALLPSEAIDPELIKMAVYQFLSIKKSMPLQVEILRQSIDARGRQVQVVLKLRVYINEEPLRDLTPSFRPQVVSACPEVHIIGAGPAGLFCALQCIESGLKPIIVERGKNVRDRRRDLALLNQQGALNEESNYCFGEGGAGTYSDGKLYTRSNKRGNVERILNWFHFFGADARILYEAHPHIGTNKLPQIIEAIRQQILECGGEIHFSSKLTDLEVMDDGIKSICINQSDPIPVKQLVLATGHSAHDIYEMLYRKKIYIESKPFALGVRVEHPQVLIDQIQYHCTIRDQHLPPASYSLVEQVEDRGVFSFCMCPGGIIAPASTRKNTVVVNGWSPSKRNNPYANSGVVVSVGPSDIGSDDALAGLQFQYQIEQQAYLAGNGNYKAPAQRMVDFSTGKTSQLLPDCSYVPGVTSADLQQVLPQRVYASLASAFKCFGKKMNGYYSNEAIVVATESRTSSPVRIPRETDSLQHVHIKNLYPCAEGAGYAGGIVSAAMDGVKIAERLAMLKTN